MGGQVPGERACKHLGGSEDLYADLRGDSMLEIFCGRSLFRSHLVYLRRFASGRDTVSKVRTRGLLSNKIVNPWFFDDSRKMRRIFSDD